MMMLIRTIIDAILDVFMTLAGFIVEALSKK